MLEKDNLGLNEKPPLISFIIPALNEEKNLVESIRPLRSIDFLKFEIIVADGGSTDGTVAIAKKIADKVFDRHGQRNINIAENRNKGASLARGKYLFFLDCGVRIENLPQLLKSASEIFETKPAVVALTVRIRFFPKEEELLDKLILGIINFVVRLLNKIKIGVSMGWVQIIRSEAFWEISGYNENLITTEDSDIFRRLNKLGKTICLKNYVAYGSAWRYHQAGWLKIIKRWLLNFLWYLFAKRSYSKEW